MNCATKQKNNNISKHTNTENDKLIRSDEKQ